MSQWALINSTVQSQIFPLISINLFHANNKCLIRIFKFIVYALTNFGFCFLQSYYVLI